MQLEYVATNRIPASSQEDINKYLELCRDFFFFNATRPDMTPITEDIHRTLVDGANSIHSICEGKSPLENLNVVHYGSLGFTSQIDYDKSQRNFRLRLFADRKLKERGFESTYEPMRYNLTSGPIQLGLNPVREVESGVETPKQNFSFEDLEKHQVDVLKGQLKSYSEEAKRELKRPKNYDDWLWGDDEHKAAMSEEIEEYHFEKEEIERAEATAKAYQTIVDYLGKTSFKDKLKKHSSLFADMRKDFAKKFPAKSEVFENTALGVLPWFHRNHMVGSFGSMLDDKGYIPSFKQGGFEDGRANFMEAEIWVPPQSNYCRRIVSLYPYTHLYVKEFNQLQEEFCDDAEVIQAMFGHELGEIVLEDEAKPIVIDSLKLLIGDPLENERIGEEEMRQTESRHGKLDKLLADIGLGEQTKKMLKLYRDKGQSLLPNYKYDYETSEALNKVIKDLTEKINA